MPSRSSFNSNHQQQQLRLDHTCYFSHSIFCSSKFTSRKYLCCFPSAPTNRSCVEIADPSFSSNNLTNINNELQKLSQHYRRKWCDRLTVKVDSQKTEIESLTRALRREIELHEQAKESNKGLERFFFSGVMY